MMTSYKAGVLRPELIRFKECLSRGLTFVREQAEAPRKKRWWESSESEPTVDSVTVSLMSQMVEKKLNAMISMCDHAFEHQHVLYLDDSDIMFIDQLKSLQEAVKNDER